MAKSRKTAKRNSRRKRLNTARRSSRRNRLKKNSKRSSRRKLYFGGAYGNLATAPPLGFGWDGNKWVKCDECEGSGETEVTRTTYPRCPVCENRKGWWIKGGGDFTAWKDEWEKCGNCDGTGRVERTETKTVKCSDCDGNKGWMEDIHGKWWYP